MPRARIAATNSDRSAITSSRAGLLPGAEVYHNGRAAQQPGNEMTQQALAEIKPVWAIGLMSGTSCDGIDAALIRGNGVDRIGPGPAITIPYSPEFRARLRAILGGKGDVAAVEHEMTVLHAAAVRRLLDEARLTPAEIAIIGFHGHTILHEPQRRRTWQIGDGALLAAMMGVDVVADLRSADVAAGGQGAPLVPLYHAALSSGLARPLAIL